MGEEQAGTGLAFLNLSGPAPGEGYRPEAGWQHALCLWCLEWLLEVLLDLQDPPFPCGKAFEEPVETHLSSSVLLACSSRFAAETQPLLVNLVGF